MKKWLIVGLGNPEGKFFGTWHNLGFTAAEALGDALGIEFKKKGNMLVGEKDNIWIQKPLTYMNRSGEAVKPLANRHGIRGCNVIIFVDDLYIDKGKIRIIRGGTSGHNGITNIKQHLGSEEYIRIKIGIKPQKPMADQANYVLDRIPEPERATIDISIKKAIDAAIMIINGEALEDVQNKFNERNEK